MAVSDRIVVMNRAVIAQEGAPRELYEAPKGAFVAGFMGDANRVRGRLRRIDERMADVDIGGLVARIPHRGMPDGDVDLAIRPEALRVGAPAPGTLPATIRKASYLGGTMEYTLDSAVGDLFVISMAGDAPLAPATPVGVTLAGHGVVVVPSA